jgi:hypothetical protein
MIADKHAGKMSAWLRADAIAKDQCTEEDAAATVGIFRFSRARLFLSIASSSFPAADALSAQ